MAGRVSGLGIKFLNRLCSPPSGTYKQVYGNYSAVVVSATIVGQEVPLTYIDEA